MGLMDWAITKILVDKIKESAMWKFLDGKKTYLTMACIIAFGVLDAWNAHCGTAGCKTIEVPAIVFSVLGALGIWTRAVTKK